MDPQTWAREHIGATFQRPRGHMRYTLREYVWSQRGWRTFCIAICDTQHGERCLSVFSLMQMRQID